MNAPDLSLKISFTPSAQLLHFQDRAPPADLDLGHAAIPQTGDWIKIENQTFVVAGRLFHGVDQAGATHVDLLLAHPNELPANDLMNAFMSN
ncbi:hypothetical protein N8I74_06680 [Chitiniphilus purpureus]|uniref:Uncharacterized protein n=1 Tax=Chitiniphilus purpureus TaxID=2981137 RepID=A0ABY6DUH3_9NEIS|nr:hypothetical protein [Chitiniphilus sp. CD1]UXY16701.1 hypothetical protein N8I74_06680 [Chitiniphilus sp. CD1]